MDLTCLKQTKVVLKWLAEANKSSAQVVGNLHKKSPKFRVFSGVMQCYKSQLRSAPFKQFKAAVMLGIIEQLRFVNWFDAWNKFHPPKKIRPQMMDLSEVVYKSHGKKNMKITV